MKCYFNSWIPDCSSKSYDTNMILMDYHLLVEIWATPANSPASPPTVPAPPVKADKNRLKIPDKLNKKPDSENSIPLSEHSTSDVLREYFAPGKNREKKVRPGLATSSGIGDSSEAFASLVSSTEDHSETTESHGTRESLLIGKLSGDSVLEAKTHGKCCTCWLRTRGLILAVLSSFQLSLTAYCAFNLHKRRYYSMPVMSLTRFSGIFFFSSIIIPWFIHHHTQIISTVYPLNTCDRRLSVLRMFLRAFIGSISIVFQFYSLKHISPADSSVILHCNPVFVAFGARLFLKEKVTICASITAILAIIGVVLISKPPFLAGEDEFDSQQLIGIGFAIAGMFTLTASVLLMRSLRELHFSMLNSVFGFTGMVTALILGTLLWWDLLYDNGPHV
ncbi:unnamed protein product [Allacma fusca]|uniref:EamA domain-containing protein n=1 Tax=Allacma fusca TaxID=39272 RepID=A0A8J2P3F0_9HEXA|nr:unnamed protein product [Allacma fusca]